MPKSPKNSARPVLRRSDLLSSIESLSGAAVQIGLRRLDQREVIIMVSVNILKIKD